jgi:thiol-disulfide isomerase/thioredoxin
MTISGQGFPGRFDTRRSLAAFLLCALTGAAAIVGSPLKDSLPTNAPHREVPDCTWQPVGDASPFTLRSLRGKVLLVDFWASWCRSCAAAFPFMDQLARDLGGQGLEVVGVNLDEDPRLAARFLSRHPAGFTVVTGANEGCAEAFGVAAMPTSYLVDRQGFIRWTLPGYSPGRAKEVRAKVSELLAEGTAHEASR